MEFNSNDFIKLVKNARIHERRLNSVLSIANSKKCPKFISDILIRIGNSYMERNYEPVVRKLCLMTKVDFDAMCTILNKTKEEA